MCSAAFAYCFMLNSAKPAIFHASEFFSSDAATCMASLSAASYCFCWRSAKACAVEAWPVEAAGTVVRAAEAVEPVAPLESVVVVALVGWTGVARRGQIGRG